LAAVNADIYEMDHRFDDLHIDAGMGPTPIPSPENAAQHDARGELERQMRERYIGGPTNGDPMQHGHMMAVTYEDAIRYSGGETREALTAQTSAADEMWRDYAEIYGADMASDVEGLNAAVDATMADLKRYGYLPSEYARANRQQFLEHVNTNHVVQRNRQHDDDAGRTGGIFSSGAAAPQREPDKMSDTDFHIAMQKHKGIY
jgi:hypothetical protein